MNYDQVTAGLHEPKLAFAWTPLEWDTKPNPCWTSSSAESFVFEIIIDMKRRLRGARYWGNPEVFHD